MAKDTDLIIRLRADTKKLSADLKKAQAKMSMFNKNITKVATSIQSTMLAAFGGAAVLQGIRHAISTIAEFEFAMDKVAAVSGATSEEFLALKKNALDLGRATKFTAGEIAGLQLELSKLGFSSEKILASTDAIRKLSTVADEDLGESAKSMAGSLNSFNLEADQSNRVANLMAESFSKSALTLEKFTVATANSGAIANALGITIESNTSRIAALVDANIDASKAGTDLRKIYIELNKAGMSYDEALEMVATSSDKVGTATELVGIRAAGALVILTEQKDKVDKLNTSLSDNVEELDKMTAIMEDNLLTDWKLFTSALDGAIQKGEVLNPILRALVQSFTKWVNVAANGVDPQEKEREAGTALGKVLKANAIAYGGITAVVDVYTRKLSVAQNALVQFRRLKQKDGTNTIANAGEYMQLNDTIDQLRAVLDELIPSEKKHLEFLEKQRLAAEAAAKAIRDLINARNSTGAGLDPISSIAAPDFDGAGLQGMTAASDMMEGIALAIKTSGDNVKAEIASVMADLWDFNDQLKNVMNTAIAATIADSIVALAAAIGQGDSLKKVFSSLLGVLATGMMEVGAAMIAMGIAEATFITSLESGQWYVAVGAGAALVAAGAALNSANKNAASSISGGASGGASSSSSLGARSGQVVSVDGRFVIEGADLVYVLGQQNNQDERNVFN